MNKFICNWNFRQFDSFISDQELLTNMENSKNNLSFLQTSIPSQIRIPIEYFWEGNGNISQKIGCHLKTFAYLLTHQAILSSKFGEPESETTSTTTLAKSSSVVAIIGWHSPKLLRKDTWEDDESFLEVIIVDKRWWEYHQSLKWLMNFGPGYFFIFPWSICMIACASASLVTMTTTISFSLFLLLLGALLQRRVGKIFWVGSTSIQINSKF